MHPFYFLKTKEISALSGFFALRRAQELRWVLNVECCVYNFSTGETHDLTITKATHNNRVHRFPAVLPRLYVRRPTTIEKVEADLKRFRKQPSAHIGRTHRVQALYNVTFTMHSEGFGVDLYELETSQKDQARSGGLWTSHKMTEAE